MSDSRVVTEEQKRKQIEFLKEPALSPVFGEAIAFVEDLLDRPRVPHRVLRGGCRRGKTFSGIGGAQK